MTKHLTDREFLIELEPVVAKEIDRHLGVAKDWMPHEYVPWSEGQNFPGIFPDGTPWDVSQSRVSPEVRTALVVNLLTEDNLPSYHREIAGIFGGDGAWPFWVHRWTAEEARHSIVIRDYLLATRTVDPDELERDRMRHMSMGFQNEHDDQLLHGIAYVSFQELATRVAHRNTGRMSGDKVLDQLMGRVALDENLHMIFYRNLLAQALELSPEQTLRAITDVVKNFKMPGHTIEGFGRRSALIAMAGIYDPRQHLDDVVQPVLRHWRIFERDDLPAEAEAIRDELGEFLDESDRAATLFVEKREERRARLAAKLAEKVVY